MLKCPGKIFKATNRVQLGSTGSEINEDLHHFLNHTVGGLKATTGGRNPSIDPPVVALKQAGDFLLRM